MNINSARNSNKYNNNNHKTSTISYVYFCNYWFKKIIYL